MTDGLFYGQHEVVEVPGSDASPGTANDATAKAPLGALFRWKGKTFRYVLFNNGTGDVAAAAGGVAHWKTLDPAAGTFTVTSDYTDAIGTVNTVAGILGAVVTDGYYTWIQVGGTCTALTAASVVAGDKLTGSSTDKTFARNAAGTDLPDVVYAVALDTRNTTTGSNTVLLMNLIW